MLFNRHSSTSGAPVAADAERRVAFWIAGLLCVAAGLSFLAIGRSLERPPQVLPPSRLRRFGETRG